MTKITWVKVPLSILPLKVILSSSPRSFSSFPHKVIISWNCRVNAQLKNVIRIHLDPFRDHIIIVIGVAPPDVHGQGLQLAVGELRCVELQLQLLLVVNRIGRLYDTNIQGVFFLSTGAPQKINNWLKMARLQTIYSVLHLDNLQVLLVHKLHRLLIVICGLVQPEMNHM